MAITKKIENEQKEPIEHEMERQKGQIKCEKERKKRNK